MNVRVSQLVLENLTKILNTQLRLSQLFFELVLKVQNTQTRVSQVELESIFKILNTQTRVSQIPLEIVLVEKRPLRLTQLVIEVLTVLPRVEEWQYSVQSV